MYHNSVYNPLNKTPREFKLDEFELNDLRQPLTEFIVPPKWALATICENTSKRGLKFEKPVTHVYPGQGPWYGMNEYSLMDVYGGGDSAAMDAEATKKSQRRKSKKGGNLVEISIGNLPDKDYRWFSGETRSDSLQATCRWCGITVIGGEQLRQTHMKSRGCGTALRIAYGYGLHSKNPICFKCAQPTNFQKWGLPLCPTCVGGWRWMLSKYAKGMRIMVTDGLLEDAFKEILETSDDKYRLLDEWGWPNR